MLISLRYDAAALIAHGRALSWLAYAGDVGSLGLVAAAAALGLLGPTLTRALAGLSSDPSGDRKPWGFLLAHASAYAVFVALTAKIFGQEAAKAPSLGWSIGWLIAASAVLASWLPLALPVSALRALRPRLPAALLVGAGSGAVVWAAGRASTRMWATMAPLTLSAVTTILRLMVGDVVVNEAGFEVGTEHFGVRIAPMCSGFEGIGLILVFLGGYIALERKNLHVARALGLLPIAVLTVWIANAFRIALLILVGSYVSPELAIGGFHSKAGWLLFCMIALGFVALVRGSRQFSKVAPVGSALTRVNPTAAYLMPILTLLALGLVTGLVTIGFDRLYPLRAAGVLAALIAYRTQYRSLAWGVHWDSVVIGVAVFVIWYLLAHGGDPAATRDLGRGLAGLGPVRSSLWIAARVAGACVLVPIAEELAFRGYLLRRLVDADFSAVDARRFAPLAWVVSSLAFGALHQDWLAAVLAGLCYAFAQQRRGRVTDAMVAHGVTNLLLALDALLLGHLHWWA